MGKEKKKLICLREGCRVAQPTLDDGQSTKKEEMRKKLSTICFISISFSESREIFDYHIHNSHALKLNLKPKKGFR